MIRYIVIIRYKDNIMNYTMQREYGKHPVEPVCFNLSGQWVLRDESGVAVMVDKYRHDIYSRYRDSKILVTDREETFIREAGCLV